MIIIYSTFRDSKEAKSIIGRLVEDKLIACGNIFDMTSIYEWKGKVEENPEVGAFLKAKKENYAKVREAICRMHSYEVPCIIRIDVEANPEYLKWVRG